MNWLQADRGHLIHPETYKIVPMGNIKEAIHVDVPFYLWIYDEPDYHLGVTGVRVVNGVPANIYSQFRHVDTLELNMLEIHFVAFREAQISFLDTSIGRWNQLNLIMRKDRLTENKKGVKTHRLMFVDFMLVVGVGGTLHQWHVDYDSAYDKKRTFPPVPGLAPGFENFGQMALSYGIRYKRYKIVYKGHTLDIKCYAFLYGVWAILLKNDMSFDSLVTLIGASHDTLTVSDFLYTVNPYITKVRFLA